MKPSGAEGAAIRGQITELDGLRGIAILLVMIYHFWRNRPGFAHFLQPLGGVGWIGVDLFFVISGFLITGILIDNLADPHFFKTFYIRRTLRIFPLYYAVLAAIMAARYLSPVSARFIHYVFDLPAAPYWYFLYLGNMREVFMLPLPGSPNLLWTLAIEEQFYLMFPLIVWLRRGRIGTVLTAVLLGAPLFRWITMLWLPKIWTVQYMSTPARLDTIAYGCLLAVILRSGRVRLTATQLNALLAAALVALGVTYRLGGFTQETSYCRIVGYSQLAATFAVVLLWAVVQRGTPITAFLRFSPLCYIGRRCYGIYLLHGIAGQVVEASNARLKLPGDVAFLLQLAGAVLIASASWRYFEEPILKLKNRFKYVESG